MTFTATPHPETAPPSVVLDYTLDEPGSIVSYEVTRNGEELRFNTVPSGDQIILTDFEALYGVLLTYIITGTFLPDAIADWIETWSTYPANWSGDTADWTHTGQTTLRTNLCRNPKLATATTDWQGFVGGGTPTNSRVVGGGPTVELPNYHRTIPNAPGAFTVLNITNTAAGNNLVTPGQTYYFIPSYRYISPSASTVSAHIQWMDAGGAVLSAVSVVIGARTSNTWYRDTVISGIAPALAVRAQLVVTCSPIAGTYTNTSELNVTGFVFDQSFSSVYFDGDTIDTATHMYEWTGAANLSTSTEKTDGSVQSVTLNADITRSASGTIQKIEVNSPEFIRIEILNAADAVVASIQFDDDVTLTGTSSSSAAGGGSFSAILDDGVIQAGADDSSWNLARPFIGVPTKVRLVALPAPVGTYLSQFGSTGSGNGQFNNPYGIAIHGNSLYVSDANNNRVQLFDSNNGSYVTKFGSLGSGNGQLNGPRGIALDSSDNVYVVDWANSRIQKFSPAGAYISQFGAFGSGNGQFDLPYDIAIDSTGNIFVVESGTNNRVQKFNSAGVYQSQFGSTGSGNGQFQNPKGIAIDSADNIFVADTNNSRVQKFNSAGVYQSQFGSFGTGNNNLKHPEGIAIDSLNNILIMDSDNQRVMKFNSAGVYQTQFGSSGVANGQFGANCAGIVTDGNNDIWVTDLINNRVQKFAGSIIPASVDDISVYLPVAPQDFFAQAETQLDSEDAWMIHPFNTALSLNIGRDTGCAQDGIEVSPETKRTAISQTRSVLLNPVGRRRWLAITQQDRMIATWDLVLVTESLADRDSILAFLVADVPFLLRSPVGFNWDLPDDWYSVGDVPDLRETYWMVPAECEHPFNLLTLPLYPVDPPSEPTPPSWTYGQDFLAYPTYADSRAAEPTYLDRLVGPG